MVIADAGGHAVVEDHAVFLAHQAVAGLAHIELGPGVGVDAVEELAGIRPLDVDLAQGRGVQQADAVAHRLALAGHGGVDVFTGLGEVPRPLPLADVFELGTVFHVPGMQCSEAHRLEQVTTVATRYRAECHRRVVGAEHGGAHFRNGDTDRTGGNRQAVDVAQFALVGTEAQRGVALDVLDRLEALAGRQLDGGGGHVVLLVDELLGCASGTLVVRHLEQRDGGIFLAGNGFRQHADGSLEACLGGSTSAAFETIGDHIAKRVDAVDAADALTFLRRIARHETEDVVTPHRTAAEV